MRSVRRAGTRPEQLLHAALREAGIEFETHDRTLPGTPDIVIRNGRLAIFVHGCFWHRHEGCRRATTPRSHTEYWTAKFADNIERDRRKVALLEASGWSVAIVWQCEIEQDAAAVAHGILQQLKLRQTS